jgi:HAD superfamily hydrolase (TIGR01509 family)
VPEPFAIDVVLFDLGGVLIDFAGVEPMKVLSGITDDDELWRRWLTCRWVRSYERGECTADEFAIGMVDDWTLPLAPQAFLEQFQSWPGGPLPDAEQLVADVRRMLPVGCLSNTNALHWDAHFSQWPILSGFDYSFLSFELGIVKPDRELFDKVAGMLPVAAERVLFLDDNAINVEGAVAAGFRARHVKGVEQARRALVEIGVLR